MIQSLNNFFRGFCIWASIVIAFAALVVGLCMVLYGIYDATMRASILFNTTGL